MEDSSSFYTCSMCHRSIPTINRLLHSARCFAFHSDLAPAPTASEVRNGPNSNLPPPPSSHLASRSVPVPSAPAASNSLPFWECQQCTFHNTNVADLQCEVCGVSRSMTGNGSQPSEPELQAQRDINHNNVNETSSQSWECRTCTCLNDLHLDHCQACEHPRPPRASTTERLIPDAHHDESLFVEAEAAYPQYFVDGEPMEPDIFFDSARRRRSFSQRSVPSAVGAPPSATTSALYGAAGGAAFAWIRGESITRGAITGAGVGLTTGVLLNELSELNRHAERMNHAAAGIDIDRHGGGAWDRERDAERNAQLMMEMRTLLEALPIDMLGRMPSGEQRGINDEQLAELPNHTFTSAPTQQPVPGSSGSSGTRTVPPQECSVCLQAYCPGEQIRTLPCFHQFHTQCVDQWLRMNAKCPICKTSATHS